MSTSQYRADIDGLRAIAVIGVILFHANLGFTGGYVGVDVFFVISGYLISRIIVREVREGRFSLQDFWVRRIRRIIPAAATVVLATFLAGAFVLEPSSLRELGKSGIAYSLMVANVFFWRSSGYFSESAELQPLLHTWSLSVEEQFYVVLPIALAFILRRKSRWTFCIMAAIAMASFTLNVSQLSGHPSAVFYLLPFRAWELLAGTLLALGSDRIKLSGSTNELLAICGIGAIVIPMLYYTGATPFPGLAAVFPVGGAVLFIASNMSKATYTGQLVSQKPFVAIGLISYSLYLWHWPLLVLSRHIFAEQTLYNTCAALVLTMILSYLSWRYIETPFRTSQRLRVPSTAFRFGATTTVVVGGIASIFWISSGLPNRFDESTRTIITDISWTGNEYAKEGASISPIGKRVGDSANSRHDFVLWGDSHGMSVAALIDKLAKERGLRGNALLSSGCPPVTGLWKPLKGPTRQATTLAINKSRFDWIIDSGVKHVILVARWKAMIDGLRDTEVDERTGRVQTYSMVVDDPEMIPSAEVSRKALTLQLTKMIERFADNGVKVWLVLQTPVSTRARVARDFYLTRRFPTLNPEGFRLDTSKSEYLENRAAILNLLTALRSENLQCIDPLPFVFEGEAQLRLYGERAYYRDEDHLTRAGAEFFLSPMYGAILDEIGKSD
ncbi:MAG: acyltransferase [Planctomycetaceae bacterium]|nr:acyltransferase [Planctomycetaceae bacterium]